MYYTKLEHPGLRQNFKYWMTNLLLAVGCVWAFLLVSGCKEPKPIVAATTTSGVEVNKDQMNEYLNNSNRELHTPEIMHTTEPTDTLKDTPPVNPQVNTSF